MSGAVEHVFRYAYPSTCSVQGADADLRLAPDGDARLYAGWLPEAAQAATALLVVARTARARYHLPAAAVQRQIMLSDPVVTAAPDALRFESFSTCCGVYARLDVRGDALDGVVQTGTTNVDFNPPMRAALAKVTGSAPLHLAVGEDEVAVLTEEGGAVERRVALPVRWLKGFGEVHVAQARMASRVEVTAAAARRFVRALPREGGAGATFHVRPSGADLRLSRVAGRGTATVAGAHRLRLIEPLLPYARRLALHADDAGGTAWVLDLAGARLTMALSPDVSRGFSGEGGLLRDLALDRAAAERAARGLVGYDVAEGREFERRLPFDLAAVERLNPRLAAAQRLVDEGAAHLLDDTTAAVRGSGTEHRVRLLADGARCSCTWFARHRGERGPCKHVLAAQLLAEAREHV